MCICLSVGSLHFTPSIIPSLGFCPWCFFSRMLSSTVHFQKVACAFALKMLPLLDSRNQIPHVIPISTDLSSALSRGVCTGFSWFSSLQPYIYAWISGRSLAIVPPPPTQTQFPQHGVWHTRAISENSMHWTPRWAGDGGSQLTLSDFHEARVSAPKAYMSSYRRPQGPARQNP